MRRARAASVAGTNCRCLTAPVLVCFAVSIGAATAGRAQDAGTLIEQARVQIDALNADSAFALLQRALDSRAGASTSQRTRGWTLLAIAELVRGNRPAALQAFQQALRLDAALKIDSLAELASESPVVFGEARTALGITDAPRVVEAPRLTVTLDLPNDTTVSVQGGLLRIETRPAWRARVVTAVAPADNPGQVVWADTQLVGGIRTGSWNLRGGDGALVVPGRYGLRATAIDSTGQLSPTIERVLSISRVPVDTAPAPEPLGPGAFAPETLQLRHGAPSGLLTGFAIAAAAAFAPSAIGNPSLKSGASYSSAYAVAGVVGVASLTGFLGGHRVKPMPENALRNLELRARDLAQRQHIARANQQLRDAAPVRVRVEGTGP